MDRTLLAQSQPRVAGIACARPLAGAIDRPADAGPPLAGELVAALAIDRGSVWPTHRIRCFLQSQAHRESKPR